MFRLEINKSKEGMLYELCNEEGAYFYNRFAGKSK